MSFVIGLSIVPAIVAGGLAWLLFRRRVWIPLAVGILVFAGCIAWFLTPLCIAIPDEDLARFDPPIETRTDTGMIGQRYFQQRDGAWYHCKARIARRMFF